MRPRKSEQHIVCPTGKPMIYTSQQSGHQLSSINITSIYTDADRDGISVGGRYTDTNGTEYVLIRAVAISASLTHCVMQEEVSH